MSSGKQNLLSKVFKKLQKAPRPQEAITPAAHAPSGSQAHGRSAAFEKEMGGATCEGTRVPDIWVQDHSKHHHGDTTYNTHGTANFVGSVANATFGPKSVTMIERAFLSLGNEAALLWNTLPKQRDIGGPENEYMDGSREDVVQDTLGWFEDPDSELGFLIQGAAGLGKSTFARHLTHRLHRVGRLAASVSLSALPSDARSPSSVVRMAARELGRNHPETIPPILEAIKSCEAAPLVDQFEMFLITPVRSLRLSHPLAVIFDAVDEYESHSALINVLSSLPATASSSIKFILLGRSNPRARKDAAICLYPLQPVSTATMERFFRKQLEDVQWEHGRRYAEARITKLAELANGLFIWAKVVCSLLQKRLSRFLPNHILESILDARRTLGDSERLATLYHQAIMLLFPDSEDQDLFREYLMATLALQESLPMDEFSAFSNLPSHAIVTIQAELKALQIRKPGGTDGEGARVHPPSSLFHLSFLEYLKSTSTPPAIAFHVSMFSSHSQLAQFCFKELPRFLPSSHPLRYLDLQPRERYAVTYVMVHIYHGTPSVKPGSAQEWERSTQCATLLQSSFGLLEQWAELFVGLVRPVPVIEECPGGSDDSQSTGRNPEELDAAEVSKYHEGRGEQHAGSEGEGTKLAESNEVSGQGVNNIDVTVDGDVPKEDVEHDTRVAQLLHGVATTLEEGRYTCRSRFRTSCLEVAVRLRPDEAKYWIDLGWAHFDAGRFNGRAEPYEQAVAAHQNALRGVDNPAEHDPGRFPYALATALRERYLIAGEIEDLNQAIALHRDGLALRPPGHPQRRMSLNNLATSLSLYVRERGPCTGEIDEVISLQREARDLLPQGHEDTSMYLSNLAINLRYRYEMAVPIADLEEAIRLGREALALCPPGYPDHVRTVDQLASSLTLLYEVLGDRGSLEEAIRLSRESISLCPMGHPSRRGIFNTLSNALSFDIEHLDEALQLSRESLSLTPLNHWYRWEIMLTLASILLSHYEQSGSAEDLEEATSVCEQALSLCPSEHFLRHKLLALRAKLTAVKSSL
ncbi:hypothetical protein FA13DRAFT_1732403 [Coprinellus micaceus]|uniref:Nephrocystin 3-like N-terminal domain-containing protein n=1 Tax=Coprinellus micaceus TaxID=71717 RepID=A0A4Y7TBM8_COPMI|nr:hypothetical protein FA13DRAFT_1732403 [Coprinellus micaceus]